MPAIAQFQLRRDTAANWTSINGVLAEGEVGLALDVGLAKIGDGSTAWNSLPWAFMPVPSGTPALGQVAEVTTVSPLALAWGDGSLSSAPITQTTQTGASYTLAVTDAQSVVRFTDASAVTVTIDANATVAFAPGDVVWIYAAGAGGLTIAPVSGVSVVPSNAALTQYEQVYLRYDGSDVWVRVG